MSDFWYRIRRRRCSIRIALTKSTRFLLAFVNSSSATVFEKSLIICRKISRFLQIALRDSCAASVKKERLFSQSLQDTTSVYLLALQHRLQRDRKLKADNPLGPSILRQCTWSSMRALTGGTINIVSGFFQRREATDRCHCLVYEIFYYRQLVTKRRHRYLRKTYLLLCAVLLEMSRSQTSRKRALKPRHRSLSSEKQTMKTFYSPSCPFVGKKVTISNQSRFMKESAKGVNQ